MFQVLCGDSRSKAIVDDYLPTELDTRAAQSSIAAVRGNAFVRHPLGLVHD
jgi:hypothetical protein